MPEKKQTAIALLKQEDVVANFKKVLWPRSQGFITSVLSIIANDKHLKEADPMSVYNAAMIAASLDLYITPGLWLAFIVPYKWQAQFQIGYKWLIQLAIRSGQFKRISSTPVFEGQLVSEHPLEGNTYDRSAKSSDNVEGYLAYFRLLNGFEAELYMTKEEAKKHASKYSASFKKWYGLWVDEFDTMAEKTVLKLLLAKYAPLSVEMQKAIIADQAVVKDHETLEVDYADNEPATSIEWPKTDFIGKLRTAYPDNFKEGMTEEQAKEIYFSKINTNGKDNA